MIKHQLFNLDANTDETQKIENFLEMLPKKLNMVLMMAQHQF